MSFKSLHSADEQDHRSTVVLDQSRAVALAKVDKAPFSYVSLVQLACHAIRSHTRILGYSMLKYGWWREQASSPMRKHGTITV
jgi:hypothetical protein